MTIVDVLIVLSPAITMFVVLANAERIVAWWDKRHPELRQSDRSANKRGKRCGVRR